MRLKKAFLVLTAVACSSLLLLLSAGAAAICLDGLGRRGENALESIYTAENVSALLLRLLPLLCTVAVLTVAGIILGIKDQSQDKPVKVKGPVRPLESIRPVRIVRAAVVVTAVLLIVLGVLNGGAWDVLVKAIHICTECIGLG